VTALQISGRRWRSDERFKASLQDQIHITRNVVPRKTRRSEGDAACRGCSSAHRIPPNCLAPSQGLRIETVAALFRDGLFLSFGLPFLGLSVFQTQASGELKVARNHFKPGSRPGPGKLKEEAVRQQRARQSFPNGTL